MKVTNILAALTCALLVFVLAGCGTTNKLQSLQITAALVNGQTPSSQAGFVTLQGNGGTIQLQVTGEYSSGKTKDLTNEVTYNVVVDPNYNQDAYGNSLIPPCTPGTCPNPDQPPPYASGTVQYNQTGLITAVEPATCSWIDSAPIVTPGTVPTPAWFYVGDYVVTATFEGFTSQPFFVPVASSAGNAYYPLSEEGNSAYENNPDGLCGPSSSN